LCILIFFIKNKNNYFDIISYNPILTLTPPSDVLRLDGTWYTLNLTQTEENRKQNAIMAHGTQISESKNTYYHLIELMKFFQSIL
jgi:hypothetical protein